MELQHISHEHPLMLCSNGKYDSETLCYGCNLRLSGDAYKCGQCEFIIHKSCTELPNKIIHLLHPKHPLILFTKSPYQDNLVLSCDICEERVWGFFYHCSICRYDLDLKCVFLNEIVKHEGHEHSFILFRPTKFICDDCGKIDDSMCYSYVCTVCQLMIHKDCDLYLPQTPLSAQPDKLISTLGYKDESTLSLLSKGVSEISLEEKDNLAQVDHFSHSCPLTLNINDPFTHNSDDEDDEDDDDPLYEKLCDACVRPLSVPFYACAPCEYFLHFACAQLPITTQNAHHPHRLKLHKRVKTRDGLFRCTACVRLCGGFVYVCELCDYFIDINCASLLKSNQLASATHEHVLNLVQKVHPSKCNACGNTSTSVFRCNDCDFNLDLKCAALPLSGRHRWDEKHLLKLTTVNIEHVSKTYFCDFCEEDRDPRYWYYSCKECALSFHPDCLFGRHYIKYGEKCRYPDHPDHDVYFLEKMKNHLRCKTECELDKTNFFVYECRTCYYHCHLGFCSDGAIIGGARVKLVQKKKANAKIVS